MKVAVLGAGPAGLYFAISMKRRNPAHEITVFERNKPDDTFGWGVVLSAETLDNLAANDAVSAAWIREYFAYWDDIAVIHKGVRTVSTGHGFCGIGRKRLLLLLQRRARDLGIELSFETEIDDPKPFMESHDLVIGADGLNSRARSAFAEVFKPDIDVRKCKFVWLGTRQKFDDAFTFIFEETEHGWVWAHAYQFESETATFIVECSEETWAKWGFGDMTREQSIAACERIFARHLGGQSLISNAGHLRGSAWINFPRVLCERWSHKNLALLGDASASAHFSIGSGTKLALESAVALADYLHSEQGLTAAFDKYESARRTEVLRLQSAARNSLEWFEEVERYLDLDPVQFNYSLLTRSQRISHENLRLRDPEWLGGAEAWFQRRAGNTDNLRRAPMFAPFQLRDLRLKNRVVVSPMAQYKAVDGCPTDWHFAHYAERAKGGAGLVYIEMTCVSPEGRITPGCTGFYAPEHEVAWKRLVDFVHAETEAKICAQIGHSGAKGSTQLGWQQIDAPLPERQLAADLGIRRRLVAARTRCPRRWTVPTWRASRGSSLRRRRWRRAAASTCSKSTPRTAICCRPSSRQSPTIAPTNTAARWRTGCAIRWRSSTPSARCGRRTSRSPCASRPTTGWATRASHRPRRSRSRGCCRPPASTSATCRPAKPRSAAARSMVACSRRRSPTASATRPAWPPWRWATSTSPTTSTRSCWPVAPIWFAWRGRISPIPTGPCMPPCSSATAT